MTRRNGILSQYGITTGSGQNFTLNGTKRCSLSHYGKNVLYGKSLQSATPSPEAPSDIVHSLNPCISIGGKNLLKNNAGSGTTRGVTRTTDGDGVTTLTGTVTGTGTILTVNTVSLPAGVYKFSAVGWENAPANAGRVYLYINNVNKFMMSPADTQNSYTVITLTAQSEVKVNLVGQKDAVFEGLQLGFQIEAGQTFTGFEPYRICSLETELTLRAIPMEATYDDPDYTADGVKWAADSIDLISGVITRKIGVKTFDGSESFSFASTKTSGQRGFCHILNSSVTRNNADILCRATHMEAVNNHSASQSSFYNQYKLNMVSYNMLNIYFYLDSLKTSAVADFKDWLAAQNTAGSPVTVYYLLPQPTTESLTSPSLATFEGVSYVNVYGDQTLAHGVASGVRGRVE
ncbi:MAG: hypothetical protein GX061_09220 [Eubacteriaceae bacterium]|nr:hypothetical protein [Eubacteriaceae bacterium]